MRETPLYYIIPHNNISLYFYIFSLQNSTALFVFLLHLIVCCTRKSVAYSRIFPSARRAQIKILKLIFFLVLKKLKKGFKKIVGKVVQKMEKNCVFYRKFVDLWLRLPWCTWGPNKVGTKQGGATLALAGFKHKQILNA